MNSQLLFVFGLLLMTSIAFARPDEYEEYEEEASQDEKETMENKETALVENDADPDTIKNKGLCHLGISKWSKPGSHVRCNCMKCVCNKGGNWACAFEYSYCPYFYCGNLIYNPKTHICCCGKLHAKKANFSCCGFYYYNSLTGKCCPYSSVKGKNAYCPRSKI